MLPLSAHPAPWVLSTQASATASAAADFELREPRFSVTLPDLELLPADRKRCTTYLLPHAKNKRQQTLLCFLFASLRRSHPRNRPKTEGVFRPRLNESSARDRRSLPPNFSPQSRGADACTNPLRPLPSPDLLAKSCVRECSGNAVASQGQVLAVKSYFRKATGRRVSSKPPIESNQFCGPLRMSENFEFLNSLSNTENFALPRQSFF